MADKSCIQNNTPSTDWLGIAEDETSPGSSYRGTPDDQFADVATPAHYQDFPNKRRQTTDRFSIRQAGGVILAFQHFLQHNCSNIFSIIRREIGAFVEYEQDRGLIPTSMVKLWIPWFSILRSREETTRETVRDSYLGNS